MAYTVRMATRDDLPRLSRAVREASYELHQKFDTPDASDIIVAGAQHGIDTQQAVVVAEDPENPDDLVGFVVWVWFDKLSPDGSIDGLGTWVHPEYRGSGLSAAMRAVARRRCVEAGRKRVSGIVALGNEAGLRAAQSQGLEVVGYVVRGDV